MARAELDKIAKAFLTAAFSCSGNDLVAPSIKSVATSTEPGICSQLLARVQGLQAGLKKNGVTNTAFCHLGENAPACLSSRRASAAYDHETPCNAPWTTVLAMRSR
jgi:hypothetical protein